MEILKIIGVYEKRVGDKRLNVCPKDQICTYYASEELWRAKN